MVLKAVADFAGIAASVAESAGKIVAALQRGAVIQVKNTSKTTLAFGPFDHESGDFSMAPDNLIGPDQVSIFGVKGVGLPKGWMEYNGQGRAVTLRLSWEVQLLSAVVVDSTLDGAARDYHSDAASSGIDGAKFDFFDRHLEGDWRRCRNCATLNHQTGGLDAACTVNAGTHDNSVSKRYEVIPGGLTLWRCCSKCECMVTAPGPCPGGGFHDLAAGSSYTIVSLPGAPGETGWQACAKCGGLVIDQGRPCPAGGTHAVIPAPIFSVQSS